MRIYIIGNGGITLCREAPVTVNEGEIAIASQEELNAAPLTGKRLRERLVSQRTGIINQIRVSLLERGIAVRQGLRFLRAELPIILATRSDAL